MEKLEAIVYTADEISALLGMKKSTGYTFIKEAYEKYGYVADPHTAVAYHVAKGYESDNKKVILSTASPYKFPASVIEGVCGKIEVDNEFKLFDILFEKTGVEIPSSLKNLEAAQSRFTSKCEKEQMTQKVYEFLGI